MMSRRASKCLMIKNVVLLENQDSSSLTGERKMSYDRRMMYRNQVKTCGAPRAGSSYLYNV